MNEITDSDRFVFEQVMLRLVRANDCTERYVSWLNDEHTTRYLEVRWSTHTLESVVEFVERARASPDIFLFAIIERSSGRHIGNIKIGPINRIHGYADLSYFVGERDVWGRGYATAAIRCATAIAFRELELNRLQAGVYSENVASARALEKAGFILEGRFREQYSFGNGRQDHLRYGLLKREHRGPPQQRGSE